VSLTSELNVTQITPELKLTGTEILPEPESKLTMMLLLMMLTVPV